MGRGGGGGRGLKTGVGKDALSEMPTKSSDWMEGNHDMFSVRNRCQQTRAQQRQLFIGRVCNLSVSMSTAQQLPAPPSGRVGAHYEKDILGKARALETRT